MEKSDIRYKTYVDILKRELLPAMGCTEPIAIAYCAARARALLGCIPDSVLIEASGNIIKNVKSVIVPNTNGAKGIEAAAAAGIITGKEELKLEVLSQVTDEEKEKLAAYLKTASIYVRPADSPFILDVSVTVKKDGSQAKARIINEHTNIVLLEKDGEVLYQGELSEQASTDMPDYSLLTVEGIVDFSDTADLSDVRELLDRQIAYNTAISQEGLRGSYGANIGKVLLKEYGTDVKNRAKAAAAAGSDARMNGCEMPVVILSGSGNQGITASLPVIEYAKEWNCSEEKLYRALLVSDLITLHQKTGIGRLSAYCGAVSAGAGAGAGIAYLAGGGFEEIAHTLVNAIAITSGIICDGAKASCAAKIAASVDAGILGWNMYRNGQQFYGGDGVVSKGVENTIRNIGRLGKDGMRETDKEIIRIMTGC
ncbi:serine dehydratase subunit alpha family protein [Clostridium sp. M62/1]|uniref:L-cysteine desulfidase family protein n=1 Tax=Clostridium sp. M62/1 TaxID=411486 RepID=UPI003561E8A4